MSHNISNYRLKSVESFFQNCKFCHYPRFMLISRDHKIEFKVLNSTEIMKKTNL